MDLGVFTWIYIDLSDLHKLKMVFIELHRCTCTGMDLH